MKHLLDHTCCCVTLWRMTHSNAALEIAHQYHRAMPDRIRRYLNARGITDEIIELHILGWNGERITIPIRDAEGRVLFFKLRKDPEDERPGPKMLAPVRSAVTVYGWERLRVKPSRIIICEGEFDRLVLEAHGFAAVTSTGGAGVFRSEWAEAFKEIPEVYVCFDRDDAGRRGALRVAELIPHTRLVELPEAVGDGGDVTDLFVRLGNTRANFLRLLDAAQPAPSVERPAAANSRRFTPRDPDNEVARLKSSITIESVIGQYVRLRWGRERYVARCPFHEDRTPSFVVYPHTQSFYCFGCQAHGDVLTFLMRAEGVRFREAVELLRQLVSSHGTGIQNEHNRGQ
jgi:DNA primase